MGQNLKFLNSVRHEFPKLFHYKASHQIALASGQGPSFQAYRQCSSCKETSYFSMYFLTFIRYSIIITRDVWYYTRISKYQKMSKNVYFFIIELKPITILRDIKQLCYIGLMISVDRYDRTFLKIPYDTRFSQSQIFSLRDFKQLLFTVYLSARKIFFFNLFFNGKTKTG